MSQIIVDILIMCVAVIMSVYCDYRYHLSKIDSNKESPNPIIMVMWHVSAVAAVIMLCIDAMGQLLQIGG